MQNQARPMLIECIDEKNESISSKDADSDEKKQSSSEEVPQANNPDLIPDEETKKDMGSQSVLYKARSGESAS